VEANDSGYVTALGGVNVASFAAKWPRKVDKSHPRQNVVVAIAVRSAVSILIGVSRLARTRYAIRDIWNMISKKGIWI